MILKTNIVDSEIYQPLCRIVIIKVFKSKSIKYMQKNEDVNQKEVRFYKSSKTD